MYLAWAMPFTLKEIATRSSSMTQALVPFSWLREWWLREGESLPKVTQRANGGGGAEISPELPTTINFLFWGQRRVVAKGALLKQGGDTRIILDPGSPQTSVTGGTGC